MTHESRKEEVRTCTGERDLGSKANVYTLAVSCDHHLEARALIINKEKQYLARGRGAGFTCASLKKRSLFLIFFTSFIIPTFSRTSLQREKNSTSPNPFLSLLVLSDSREPYFGFKSNKSKFFFQRQRRRFPLS